MIKKIFLALPLCLICPFLHADDNVLQNYYDDATQAVMSAKRCADIKDQFSSSVTKCYFDSSKLIQKKTNDVYKKYESFYQNFYNYTKEDHYLIQKNQQLISLKKQCETFYPPPLRDHFKNQILSCQVEIDLQRFFFFYTTYMNG